MDLCLFYSVLAYTWQVFKKSYWIKEVKLIYIPNDCCDILETQAITLGWLIKEKLYGGYWWKIGVSGENM